MSIKFIGQLSGDGECSFIKADREETIKVKPYLDKWYANALIEMDDYTDEEKEEELKFIKMDEQRIYLDDIFTYFQCKQATKYKITIKIEEL